MMCFCKTGQQSRWTRRNTVARTRRVRHEANSERARAVCMIAIDHATGVTRAASESLCVLARACAP